MLERAVGFGWQTTRSSAKVYLIIFFHKYLFHQETRDGNEIDADWSDWPRIQGNMISQGGRAALTTASAGWYD